MHLAASFSSLPRMELMTSVFPSAMWFERSIVRAGLIQKSASRPNVSFSSMGSSGQRTSATRSISTQEPNGIWATPKALRALRERRGAVHEHHQLHDSLDRVEVSNRGLHVPIRLTATLLAASFLVRLSARRPASRTMVCRPISRCGPKRTEGVHCEPTERTSRQSTKAVAFPPDGRSSPRPG